MNERGLILMMRESGANSGKANFFDEFFQILKDFSARMDFVISFSKATPNFNFWFGFLKSMMNIFYPSIFILKRDFFTDVWRHWPHKLFAI